MAPTACATGRQTYAPVAMASSMLARSRSGGASRSKATPYSYLSVVDGELARHATWAECERRVKGRAGARFKKAMNQADEAVILRDWGIADRIALVLKDAVFALLPGVIGICIVAAQRLNPSMFVGQVPKPNSAVDINNRFILNTFEQFTAYFVANAGLAMYCPPEEARSLPLLTMLFVMGRILFWIGYHRNPYLRAFGFGITFYPTVVAFAWLMLIMVFGIRIPL